MTFTGNDANGGGGMFPQHPKSGPWESLKGGTLAPHEQPVMTSSAMGDSRHIDSAGSTPWDSQILVNTGMTHGGGAMAK